jgi:hypothetical protein
VGPSTSPTNIDHGLAWLDLLGLSPVMARTSGRPEIAIGLIDGPIVIDHPDLAAENIQEVPGNLPGACAAASSAACTHGTFVAGILLAKRGSAAPAICPECSLLVRSIFAEAPSNGDLMPSATAEELADAMLDVIDAGARIVRALARAGPRSRPASRRHHSRSSRESRSTRQLHCYPPCVGNPSGCL